jgi:hypothetical protein
MSSGFPVPFFRQVGVDDPNIFGYCHSGYLYTPVIRHLWPFAMWTAFPFADYYGHSVALGLAAGRRSRVRSNRTSERDTGPSFDPLNDLVGRHLDREAAGSSKFCVDYLDVYVLVSLPPGQACASTRQRNKSNPARPYMSRLMTLSLLT